MKRLVLCTFIFVGMARGTVSASAPWRVTALLQNDFAVLSARDSILVAAGPNSIMSAVFDKTSRQFLPFAFHDFAGPALKIKRQGEVVVVQSAAGTLSFFDAASLPSLGLLGAVFPSIDYLDFAVDGNRLFLACGFGGVRQFAISNYSNLILLDSSLDPVHPIAVASEPGQLYVVDDYTGVYLFGPTATELGTPLSLLTVGSPATSITVRNDTAYIGSEGAGILVVLNQFDSLQIADTLTGQFFSGHLELTDTLLLSISADGRRAELLSLRGHYNPMFADSGTAFEGGSAFICGGTQYFATPATPGQISLYDLDKIEVDLLQPRPANPYGGDITDVCVLNNQVIVSRHALPTLAYAVQVVPPSLHGVPVLPGLGGVDQIERADNALLLYSGDQQTLAVVAANGSDFELFSMVGPFSDEITSFRVTEPLYDSLRLLCLIGDASIDVMTLNPALQTVLVARLYFPEQPFEVAVTDTLIVIGSAQSVYVYSINPDFVMTYRSTINLSFQEPAPNALVRLLTDKVNASSSIWVVRFNGIERYNLTDPGLPTPNGQVDIPVGFSDASISGDYIYASSVDGGLLRIHAPPGSNPVITDSIRLTGNRVGVSGTSVALASQRAVWLIDWDIPSGVDDSAGMALPFAIDLAQNYPNPFNPMTTIEYTLTQPSPIDLSVYNLLGQPVRQLVADKIGVGMHRVVFDASGLSSGVYFYRLITNTGSSSRKMVLVK